MAVPSMGIGSLFGARGRLPDPRSVTMTKKKPAFSRASSMAGLFSPTRSKRIHKSVLDCKRIESISDPMREFIEELWPELVHKLPPKKAHG